MSRSDDTFSCVLLGEESLAIECGEILLGGGHQIRAVVTESAPIAEWCATHDLTVLDPRDDLVEALGAQPFDYLFSITNLRMLPEALLALPGRNAINFHDGPLPRYAGLYTPAWALINRESEYGVSFHTMSAGVDEGDLLAQQLFEISPEETSLTLNTKCFEAGIEAFTGLVQRLADGSAEPRSQDLTERSYFGRFDRPAAAAALDWSESAERLEALVRALDFGRYDNPLAAAKLHHAGHVLVVRAAEAVAHGSGEAPGTLIQSPDDALVVATADGALRMTVFETSFGEVLSPSEAGARLGVASGDRLGGVTSELANRLTEANAALCRSESHWLRRLGALTPIDLPYLQPREAQPEGGPEQTGTCQTLDVDLPETIGGHWARTPEHSDGLLAAVAAYFARLSGQERFHLSYRDSELAARGESLEDWVAPRVPLRVDAAPEASIGEFVAALCKDLGRVRKWGTWLHDAVGRTRALQGNPVLVAGGLLSIGVEISAATEAPPRGLDLCVRVSPDGQKATLYTDPRVVTEADAGTLAEQLSHFVARVAEASEGDALSALPLLRSEERERILREWNQTERDYARDRCIHELFEEQVARTPGETAVAFEDQRLTYRELDERANRLAHHLRALGAGPDQLIGVHIGRSLEMMVAILAVQKAGAAYVPMDPAYPRERVAGMIEDSKASIVLTQESLVDSMPSSDATVVCIDRDWVRISSEPASAPESGATPANLAYVIYTSGSTGKPKGVMVEHRNVVNFFAGMDQCIEHEGGGVWLAVTSLSFDISVLELLWTLTRGFEVVLYSDTRGADEPSPESWRPIDFGLFMWGSDDCQGSKKYDLMLEGAKFGDHHGFSSIWTPERHFHAFGGPYPNPSVTSAAIASVTDRIAIRAGSCVLPLHHPIRVAEEWAVVDNISNGRVGIAFAAGWQPNDFVIRPESYKDAKGNMFRDIETVRRLWRGESVEFTNPLGQEVSATTLPKPVQPELPVWVTTAGNPETFRQAGAVGANLLTHLLGQTVEEVGEKIQAYRDARREAGFDPDAGVVTLMLHTLVGDTDAEVKELAREPMKSYLSSSVALVKDFAWAFPAFKRPGGVNASPDEIDLDSLSPEEFDAILEFAFERYFETSGLFGSVETCMSMVDKVKAIGVDEIGCLIDYGVPTDVALASLEGLNRVRERANQPPRQSAARRELDLSFAAQVERHGVTHMQCTPSMARMLVMDDESRPALGRIGHLMIGGEAFPPALAAQLDGVAGGRVTNMYGPTETTIWSSTKTIEGKPEKISIGRPIANTQLYVLDGALQPVPVGVTGELMIGGDGVVRGYHDRPELTAERFIPDPFSDAPGARLYRTGDHARFSASGDVEFLGRMDHQVKIRGYRVELGEIEARMASYAGIRECVVVVREDTPGDQRLVAYAVCEGDTPDLDLLKRFLGDVLPDFMVPGAFCFMDALPLTANGKTDRNALPAPEDIAEHNRAEYTAPESDLEQTIATVWQEVLKLESVGTRDNFFDLGGHSLLVVQAHRLLKPQLEATLSLTDLYRFPTIHSLVDHIEQGGGGRKAAEQGEDRAAKRKAARAGRLRRKGGQ